MSELIFRNNGIKLKRNISYSMISSEHFNLFLQQIVDDSSKFIITKPFQKVFHLIFYYSIKDFDIKKVFEPNISFVSASCPF